MVACYPTPSGAECMRITNLLRVSIEATSAWNGCGDVGTTCAASRDLNIPYAISATSLHVPRTFDDDLTAFS
ncbi:unnamed protein product, partial [Iphiclides podalirius]